MKSLIFCMLIQIYKNSNLIEMYLVSTLSKMGVATLGLQDSKNYFKNSGKLKVTLIIFGVVVVKNGLGILLGHGILKYVPSQD